jgi:hypothetical protein
MSAVIYACEMPDEEREPMQFMVCCLPWASVEQEVAIGPVTFWPFRKLERTRITDPDIRCFLGRYFDSYVDWMGDIEDGITIVCHTRDDFRELNSDEKAEVQEAVNWLSFSAMARCLVEHATHSRDGRGSMPLLPKGDHFQMHWKAFRLEDDHVSIHEEGVLAGFRMGRIRLPRPLHLPTSDYRYNPDSAVLDPLRELLGRPDLRTLRTRINRSLEWFLMACSGGSAISPLVRSTMLATAFEILLNFPDGSGEKKKYFADTMSALLGVPGLRTSIRTVGRAQKQIDYALPAAWACDFYKLRSTITHGDEVAEPQWAFEGLPSLGLGKVLVTAQAAFR